MIALLHANTVITVTCVTAKRDVGRVISSSAPSTSHTTVTHPSPLHATTAEHFQTQPKMSFLISMHSRRSSCTARCCRLHASLRIATRLSAPLRTESIATGLRLRQALRDVILKLCYCSCFLLFSCLVTQDVRGLLSAPLTMASRDLDPLVSC